MKIESKVTAKIAIPRMTSTRTEQERQLMIFSARLGLKVARQAVALHDAVAFKTYEFKSSRETIVHGVEARKKHADLTRGKRGDKEGQLDQYVFTAVVLWANQAVQADSPFAGEIDKFFAEHPPKSLALSRDVP